MNSDCPVPSRRHDARHAAWVFLALLPALFARIDPLLVPPAGAVDRSAGLTLTLQLNNPTDRPDWIVLPARIEADYAYRGKHGRTQFSVDGARSATGVEVPAGEFRTVTLRLEGPLDTSADYVSLRLTQPSTNAIMFRQVPPGQPAAVAAAARPARVRTPMMVGDHMATSGSSLPPPVT